MKAMDVSFKERSRLDGCGDYAHPILIKRFQVVLGGGGGALILEVVSL